ncbi:MAG: hypothetical protein SPG50_07915 [Muribaculaceae bacterium]|nr:hypothetical protein [Muribaculaceae bacterium]
MKKGVKIGLIGCGSIAVLAIVAIGIMVLYLIGGDSQGTPQSVKYHNASDLQKITKIQFPDVELVDSTFYDSFSLQEVTEKFILKDKNTWSALENTIENGKYWEKIEDGYKFYILPEDSIEEAKELTWRKTQDGQDDWDGNYIEILVPSSNDTIIVKYGWVR